MLSINSYSKSYGKTSVLSIPSLELPPGVYWLRGDNGAGKSTLLRSVAGLVPFQGNISLDGLTIRKNRMEFTRAVRYAVAEPLYPAFLSGNDLLNFYEKTLNTPPNTVAALAQLFGADKYSRQKTGTYSSGMTKKLSLALAFAGNPKLVLLDEPLITLDTNAVDMLTHTISRYAAAGTMFIITSHQELVIAGCELQQLWIRDKTLHV